MKRLVVTADDFGLTPGVVAGIISAHERGIVTSTSLMVNAPAAEAAFAEARRRPELAVGLHFVLTFGEPCGPREPLRDLVDGEGRFRHKDSPALPRARPEQVREELRAQLRRFEDRAGRPPSHIDGHHHAHLHPGVLRAVIEEAGRLGVPVRSTDRAGRERLRLERIRTCDRFLEGFYGEEQANEETLLEILERLPRGTSELMCHPAEEDDWLFRTSGYAAPRLRELHALTSPRVREAVSRLGIELLPMSRVGASARCAPTSRGEEG